MRKVINTILLSFLIEFVLVLTACLTLYKWPETLFFILFYVVLGWPIIWFTIIVMSTPGATVDPIKMQNLYNLDAVRRNTDRMTP